DLDGAKEGTRKNREIIFDIAKNTTLKVQTGGGIRTMNDIEDCLKNGISRVIIGSAAVKDPMFVKNVVLNFGDKIAVGIDEKRGAVAVEGWLENSGVSYLDLAKKMCENGVKYFIYTDIERDGMLNGPNHDKTKHLQKFASEYDVNVIASGGIKNIDDIIKLKKNSVYGAICGKSIYSGTLDLREAIAYCKKEI
ncbi:MAG: 1-(5-phosphoribosyl)-5-((5-phosphoribosylamino)methylideneamino)imidazole-4-carboxamide isomerase, partial [Oscillospiraceae bacterium]|nr:1-(5-phosphoribosyl)-5-((5-phosphoribosylamino)methylideneamino)imidazole-4-carboxamide isomerase [Oscillospiraceae bacterium]